MGVNEETTIEIFVADLLISSNANRRESDRIAPGSWGSGYDQGYYDAVKDIKMKLQQVLYPVARMGKE